MPRRQQPKVMMEDKAGAVGERPGGNGRDDEHSHRTDDKCTPEDGPPRVSVIIPTRDRPADLDACLRSVTAAVGPTDEIIVADSASRSGGTAEVAQRHGAIVVRCDLPGASLARNAGARAARGSVLAFTDDDCRPQLGWTHHLAAAFDDPAVGFVSGAVLPGTSGGTVSIHVATAPLRFRGPVDPIEIGHGANMAFRRAAFEAAGGFDELLGAGGRFRGAEDHDLFFRVLCLGWDGRFVPSAEVVHEQWRGGGARLRVEFGYGLGSGAFAGKAVRSGAPQGWRLLGRRLWRDGVARAWRDVRDGYESGAAMTLVRTSGVVAGCALGAAHRVRDDRYVR